MPLSRLRDSHSVAKALAGTSPDSDSANPHQRLATGLLGGIHRRRPAPPLPPHLPEPTLPPGGRGIMISRVITLVLVAIAISATACW